MASFLRRFWIYQKKREPAKLPNLLSVEQNTKEPNFSNQLKIVNIHVDKTWLWFISS